MIYLVGVNHYVQYGPGPLGESFTEFLQDQIKAFQIVLVAESLTSEKSPQAESNAFRVAKKLAIDYRACDELRHAQRVSRVGADAFLMERYWLAKIEDKIRLHVMFICQADYLESFSVLLINKNHSVKIISKNWFVEEDFRRKLYSSIALSFLEVRQLLSAADLIARNAVLLNRGFGNLFGYLQRSLTLQIFLTVNQLYERQDSTDARQSISIPIIAEMLKKNSGNLGVKKRSLVHDGLSKVGYSRTWLDQLSDERIVNEVVDHFAQRLDKLAAAISSARGEIDHLLSHKASERHAQRQEWDVINDLIAFASEFYEMIGEGILGISGRLDVSETLDQSLKRLLKAAKMEVD